MSTDKREQANKLTQKVQEEMKKRLFEEKIRENSEAYQRKEILFKEELDKFQKSRITSVDKEGNTENDWGRSDRQAKDAISTQTNAYNSEWKIAMLGLVGMLSDLNIALHNSVTQILKQPVFLLEHKLLPEIWNKLKKDPEAVLPILIHEVKLNEHNQLEVNLTEKGHGATGQFDEQFKSVVVEWLNEQGYTPDPDPNHQDQFIHSNSKETLTRTAFEALKNDEVHGLDQFLTASSELQFQPKM